MIRAEAEKYISKLTLDEKIHLNEMLIRLEQTRQSCSAPPVSTQSTNTQKLTDIPD